MSTIGIMPLLRLEKCIKSEMDQITLLALHNVSISTFFLSSTLLLIQFIYFSWLRDIAGFCSSICMHIFRIIYFSVFIFSRNVSYKIYAEVIEFNS